MLKKNPRRTQNNEHNKNKPPQQQQKNASVVQTRKFHLKSSCFLSWQFYAHDVLTLLLNITFINTNILFQLCTYFCGCCYFSWRVRAKKTGKEANPSDSKGLRKRICLESNDSHIAQPLTPPGVHYGGYCLGKRTKSRLLFFFKSRETSTGVKERRKWEGNGW